MNRKKKSPITDWHDVVGDKYHKRREQRNQRRENQRKSSKYSIALQMKPTKAEMIVDDMLAAESIIYNFQKPFYSDECAYIVDFYFKNVEGKKYVIEIDGEHHNTPRQKEYDKRRSMFLYARRNCCVKRFTNEEVFKEPEKVLAKILALQPRYLQRTTI